MATTGRQINLLRHKLDEMMKEKIRIGKKG